MGPHEQALEGLRRIYAQADGEAKADPGLSCELSGRCCRFREAGHVLFVTRLEYDEMVRCGGPAFAEATAAKAGAGGAPGNRAAGEEGLCPWLRGTLCGNREGRALACRTYFCSDEAAAAALTEKHHREIRKLHERHGIPYDYRPLHDQILAVRCQAPVR